MHDASHEQRKNQTMATITPKELAVRCDTDGRTMRKFLRSSAGMDTKVGKGHRWAIDSRKAKSLIKGFNAWNEARKADSDNDAESTDAPETPNDA
jgi:phage terminase Nu1 subunit (DNA packaging protein)